MINSGAGSPANTHIPQVTVDSKGRITSINTVSISAAFLTNGTAAGGDLGGTFPSPTVVQVNGISAADIEGGSSAANNATTSATPSRIVLRDGSGSASFTNIFLGINVVTTSTTPAFNIGSGAIQQMTITANVSAMTCTGMTPGQLVIFDFVHDSSSVGFAIAWAANIFGGSTTTGTAATKHNTQIFWTDGTNLFALDAMRVDLG